MGRLKECDPYDTVLRIRRILEELKIFTTESWIDSAVSSLFSVRVVLSGTQVGTNGKGVTRVLALASAYGEFMERLSNGMLLSKFGIDLCPHYSYGVTLQFEQVAQGGRLIDAVLFAMQEGVREEFSIVLDRASDLDVHPEERVRRLSAWGIRPGQDLFCLPYTGLLSGRKEMVPMPLVQHYGSNGMAAGNTRQEAVVQAISEIFERWSLYYIFTRRLTPPVVERDVIQAHFPAIDAIMSEIESFGHFHVEVRDCSLGRGLPAYCACLCDRRSHRYAISFGASPNISTCLERLFTELVQGRRLHETAWSKIGAPLLIEPFELRRLFRNSTGNYPPEFWLGEPSWEVDEALLNRSCETNQDALNWFSSLCAEAGTDIFARDCSVFGFPSVHVVIPGFSEVMGCSPLYLHYLSALRRTGDVLDGMAGASREQIAFLLEFLDFCRKMNAADMAPLTRIRGWKGMQVHEGVLFFLARGYAELGDFRKAAEFCCKLKELSPAFTGPISCLADHYNLWAARPDHPVEKLLANLYEKDVIVLARRMHKIPLKELVAVAVQEMPDIPLDVTRLLARVKGYVPEGLERMV
ncbi:YcaO-like family protein [Nitratidesulfovibrio sp. 1201_IL3209]|uniref:YcaO-like family protein n=1 Tax=Nitratidesulfovibrio sp. 1201_IL3209 TaxID=3084053 RepID=UPI002FD9E1E5